MILFTEPFYDPSKYSFNSFKIQHCRKRLNCYKMREFRIVLLTNNKNYDLSKKRQVSKQ